MIEVTELIDEQPVKQFLVDMQTLPEVSAEDDGKILGVDGGEWKVVDNNGLPAVTQENDGSVLMVVDGQWIPVLEQQAYTIDDTDRQNITAVDFNWNTLVNNISMGKVPMLIGLSGRLYRLQYADFGETITFMNFVYCNILLSSGTWSLRIEKITVRSNGNIETSDMKSCALT